MEGKLRQWRERFGKLVNYLRNKVFGLFKNKDKDFLSPNDYEKIYMKSIIKKVAIVEEKNDDVFNIEM